MLKKLMALLLALVMIATLAACKDPEQPTPDTPSDPSNDLEDPAPLRVKSGEIPNSELSWELYTDGVLYIKGTGEMGEFEANSGISTRQPWHDYIGNTEDYTIKKVFVEAGVTSLSEGAFQNCINLESVEINSEITVIPAKCFNRCVMLRTLRAKGVREIGDGAFQHCERLTTLTVSATLDTVWDGAFSECATKSTAFAVRLAGNATEWDAAKARMDESQEDDLAIWTGNDVLLTALEKVTFVSK